MRSNQLARLILIGAVALTLGCSKKGEEEGEDENEPAGPLTPGGMAYGNYYWPDPQPEADGSTGYKSYEISVAVTAAPAAGSSYFWASQFFLTEGNGGYIGLQDNGNINGVVVGKMAIFSWWDTLSAQPGGQGTSCQTFGGEGVGFSCRVAYEWVEGRTYRLRVYTDSATPHVWTGAIVDTQSGVETTLGSITAPSDWQFLSATNSIFAEYFTETKDCAATPAATAEFSSPQKTGVDGNVYQPGTLVESYGTAKCDNALATVDGMRIVVQTGGTASR